jgi:hypothetical protein
MPVSGRSGTSLWPTFRRLSLVALATFVVLAALDLLLVRGPRPASQGLGSNVIWAVIWLFSTCVTGTGFFVTLLHHYGDQPEPNIVKPALLSVALAGLWLALAFVAVVNLHFLVGGRL